MAPAQASNAPEAAVGLVRIESDRSVEDTAKRLEGVLQARGLTVFAKIDHEMGARSVGLDLRPTQIVIFGNPRVGTPLMQCAQSVAIDLPQKALIWEDAGGQVWIGYNAPSYLKTRHSLSGCEEVLGKVETALDTIAREAAAN